MAYLQCLPFLGGLGSVTPTASQEDSGQVSLKPLGRKKVFQKIPYRVLREHELPGGVLWTRLVSRAPRPGVHLDQRSLDDEALVSRSVGGETGVVQGLLRRVSVYFS